MVQFLLLTRCHRHGNLAPMPHLHLNAAQRRNLFSWLSTLPGFDVRWRLMRRLHKTWRIKDLDRDADDYTKKLGREIVQAQLALDAPDEKTGEKPTGLARYDLSLRLVELEQKTKKYPMYDPELPPQQFQIDDADIKALYALMKPLRTEPAADKPADPAKPGTVEPRNADWEVYGAICDAVEEAHELKEDRPCPTCRALREATLRAVTTPELPAASAATPESAPALGPAESPASAPPSSIASAT